ncbi:Arc family DNA-binding protein [Xenorhabdus bovienii]|uniref:Arc-like DNA binding domain-containing protein n=1 Tax=Xenorhabdus bovienii str. kraussei Becker Underwood TaxID=1398204 RepID=A0A077Q2Y7_XENBV|nr:Arc family DNA-binding protein [Xenorhabdus bovienii]CDH26414.1 hypothetical protein XBKB1_660026 [Xenorhabdus bovienii str. kraussei Becker Underwood]
MSKKDVQLNIRITQELKEQIEESAKENNRSINAEAITLMESALAITQPAIDNQRKIKKAAEQIQEHVELTPSQIEKLMKDAFKSASSDVVSHSVGLITEQAKKIFLDSISNKYKK